jgi:integrase
MERHQFRSLGLPRNSLPSQLEGRWRVISRGIWGRYLTMKLTKQSLAAIEIESGKTDQIIFDDALPGFGLRLRASGFKSWICQYERNGTTRRLTLGSVAVLDIEQARFLARKHLAEVTLGGDPHAEKQQAKLKAKRLLRPIIDQYLAARKPKLRASSYSEVSRYLLTDFRSLHNTPISAIQRIDIAAILRDKASTSPVSARQARSAVQAFFAWAICEGFTETNPVVGTNKYELGPARDRVLSDEELVAVWKACEDDDFGRIVRLLILTGSRRDEIAGMRWPEFGIDNRTWTLPGERAKNKRALTLSLPNMAWNIVESIEHRPWNNHLFGSGPNGFTHWNRKLELDKQSGVSNWVIHDLRRTTATRMVDLGVQPHHVEAVLNHQGGHRGGVAGIYNRATYAKEIRAALIIWADHVASIVSGEEREIVQFAPQAG